MFTKLLDDVQALVALLMHAYTRRYCIRFKTPEQKVKAVNFDVCKKTKLIVYHSNVPQTTAKRMLK